MAELGCHIFKQISFNYINIQLNIQFFLLRESKQYPSSSRASLLPRDIGLLAGNWNLADSLNGFIIPIQVFIIQKNVYINIMYLAIFIVAVC